MAFENITFSVGEILTASNMNKVDTNIDEVRRLHKGSSEPADLQPGVLWLDDTLTDRWLLKIRDSSGSFIRLFSVSNGNSFAQPNRLGALLRKTAGDQSIPNEAFTKATWDTVEYNTSGFFKDAKDSLDIPHGGISKVILRGSAVWASSNAGLRTLRFRKNGLDFAGNVRFTARAFSNAGLTMVSHPIDVASGDEFTLEVFQNSGGSLDLLQDRKTMFSIQVVG